jgi:hypothetical protein
MQTPDIQLAGFLEQAIGRIMAQAQSAISGGMEYKATRAKLSSALKQARDGTKITDGWYDSSDVMTVGKSSLASVYCLEQLSQFKPARVSASNTVQRIAPDSIEALLNAGGVANGSTTITRFNGNAVAVTVREFGGGKAQAMIHTADGWRASNAAEVKALQNAGHVAGRIARVRRELEAGRKLGKSDTTFAKENGVLVPVRTPGDAGGDVQFVLAN